jgi:hypothetical protein
LVPAPLYPSLRERDSSNLAEKEILEYNLFRLFLALGRGGFQKRGRKKKKTAPSRANPVGNTTYLLLPSNTICAHPSDRHTGEMEIFSFPPLKKSNLSSSYIHGEFFFVLLRNEVVSTWESGK